MCAIPVELPQTWSAVSDIMKTWKATRVGTWPAHTGHFRNWSNGINVSWSVKFLKTARKHSKELLHKISVNNRKKLPQETTLHTNQSSPHPSKPPDLLHVCNVATGLCTTRRLFHEAKSHTTYSFIRVGMLRFNECQVNVYYSNASSVKFSGGGFPGKWNADVYMIILYNPALSTLWRFYGIGEYFFPDDTDSVHVVASFKHWYQDMDAKHLQRASPCRDIKPTEHFCGKIERPLMEHGTRFKIYSRASNILLAGSDSNTLCRMISLYAS